MGVGAPYRNRNAEKWTFKKAVQLYHDAIELTNQRDKIKVHGNDINGYKYDFIGEIAGELGTFKEIFIHLLKRFNVLKRLDSQLHTNIERNCYSNGKKGVIKEASAIMNLKANHKWKDRVDNTSGDEPIQPISLDPKTAKAISKKIDSNM